MIESWHKCAKCKQWFAQYVDSCLDVTITSTQMCLCDDCKIAEPRRLSHGIDWDALIINNHETFTKVTAA